MQALKNYCFVLLLAVFVTGAAWAQTNDQSTTPPPANAPGQQRWGGKHRGQSGIERMAQELNLTDQQKTQIQNIFQTQRQQAQSIRQDTSLTPEQRQSKLKQLRDSTHQQIQGVLTPEQQQKFQQLRSEHQGMRHGKMGPGGKGPGGMARLNLTPDQKAQIQPIMQSARQQVQTVRQDTSLTAEQKQAKIREIHQNTRSQIEALLTPEQQQQLQQMWQHRGRRGPQAPPPPPSGF